MSDGFCWESTRLRTALEPFCCRKRVISSFWIENCCQLMIVPGALVTLSVLPLETNVALPAATEPPVGLAKTYGLEATKAAPTANEMTFRRGTAGANARRSRR